MQINYHNGHLSYCSNIHPGESWLETFNNIKTLTTQVRSQLTNGAFGLGLRLSNQASKDLEDGDNLAVFKKWLSEENMYVFTVNGFPFGGFHFQEVKDKVHQPDWTTEDRYNYTIRLFNILAELLPEGLDGGVSTSPVSYKYWHNSDIDLETAKSISCKQMAEIAIHLAEIKKKCGKSLHLDIEPEPDGVLESGPEFIDFYNDFLLAEGKEHIAQRLGITNEEAQKIIFEHLQICFDVCHFAVGFENIQTSINDILSAGIKVGRIQISAALSTGFLGSDRSRKRLKDELAKFDEPTYLHQAVVLKNDGSLKRYPDLGPALADFYSEDFSELRTHFHVPIFTERYGNLLSTQKNITETLKVWKDLNFTNHLEVETYTWDVLPLEMRTDIVSSVVRELNWVTETLDSL